MRLLDRNNGADNSEASSPEDDEDALVFEGETLSNSPRLLRRAYRRIRGDT